jgi:hypothetical protein
MDDDFSGAHIKHLLKAGRSIMNENPSTRPIFAAQTSEVNFPTMGTQPFEAKNNANNYYAGQSPYGERGNMTRGSRSGIRSGLQRNMFSA